MSELKLPEQWAHLRCHWLYAPSGRIEQYMVAYWIPESKQWRSVGSVKSINFEQMGVMWRYHGPCDPAAIIPDAGNEEQRLAVGSAIIDDPIDPEASFVDRMLQRKEQITAILTALARLGAGS